MMKLTNPFITLLNFFKLSISRYTPINLMGKQLDDIFNFLPISNSVATAGQPTEQQLSLLKDAGYQVVINLAPHTAENALPNEKMAVESLGLEYVHIPVNFNQPTREDFEQFCTSMEENAQKSIFVHCAANMRVSAFMYLYRRLNEGLSNEQAQIDLQKIWTPNTTWRQFMDQVIAQN